MFEPINILDSLNILNNINIEERLFYTLLRFVLFVLYLLFEGLIKNYDKIFYKILSYTLSNNNFTVIGKNILDSVNFNYIVISNHISIYDTTYIRSIINCYTVSDYNTIPFEYLHNKLNLIPYKRGNTDSGLMVKTEIIEKIKNGNNVLVFPEGRHGDMLNDNLFPFKKGLFHLSYNNDIPILLTIISSEFPNSENIFKKIKAMIIYNNYTKIIYELIEFVYPHDFNTFDEYYNYIVDKMNKTYKKYKK